LIRIKPASPFIVKSIFHFFPSFCDFLSIYLCSAGHKINFAAASTFADGLIKEESEGEFHSVGWGKKAERVAESDWKHVSLGMHGWRQNPQLGFDLASSILGSRL
jgi:hypothetical protein